MLELFEEWKVGIARVLRSYLEEKEQELGRINEWGADVCRRLVDFSTRGKMIRGGLIIAGCRMFGGEIEEHTLRAAAAMELLQSSFLIHDDIMDRDEVRRGAPTVFVQYAALGANRLLPDPARFGDSHAICAGDVAFFFAFDLLSRLAIPGDSLRRVLAISNRAVMETCVAQMQDVYFGSLPAGAAVAEEDVLRVYHYKTGRYTFTLPLQVGAVLAGCDEPVLEALEILGELFGVIFQIKDDEIGLFGDEGEIGKPVGSDVLEGKKTIFYAYLHEAAGQEQRKELGLLFGGRNGTVTRVRELVRELGVRDRVERKLAELALRARNEIARLPGAGQEGRDLLAALLDYNLRRAR
jgi:geranylgeranyl diphosphate synthase type I